MATYGRVRTWTVWIAMLASGCLGPPDPVGVAEVPPPPGADVAAELARQEWSDRLGADFELAADIRWFAGADCLRYDGDPECTKGATWTGHHRTQIHLIYADHPSETALVHELLHLGLHETSGDGDPGHELPIWATDDRADIRAHLADMGL